MRKLKNLSVTIIHTKYLWKLENLHFYWFYLRLLLIEITQVVMSSQIILNYLLLL